MIRQHGFHGNTTKTAPVFLFSFFFALLSPNLLLLSFPGSGTMVYYCHLLARCSSADTAIHVR